MKLQKALDKAKFFETNSNLNNLQTSADISIKPIPLAASKTAIIELDSNQLKHNRCVCISSDAPENEAYKVLRAQIQQRTKEKGWNTVMLTSTLPGEGKTLNSINLALTFAKELAQTILLVDCDLKRQDIHKRLGVNSSRNLVDYLVDDCPINELLLRSEREGLAFISGKRTIQESSELLGSPKMKDLVNEMKNRYKDRYIFFETPPILAGADAVAFSPLVDCIIMVVEANRTSIHDINKALSLIPRDKFLGFILNRFNHDSEIAYMQYGYAKVKAA